MLDPRRERIQDDLRGLLDGDVLAYTAQTQVYSTDASLYEIQPLCVVCPKTTRDVISVVRYARENGLSIHPRGSGSSCSGAPLGEGIILDMSRFMRRLLYYDPKTNILHVQAGMQCSRLNELLAPYGRHILPGAGHSWPNTVGGLLSIDGYGSRWLSFGRPSDWLLEVEMVTASGNTVTFSNQEPIPEELLPEFEGLDEKSMKDVGARAESSGPKSTQNSESGPLFNLPGREDDSKSFELGAVSSPEDEKKRMIHETAVLLKEYRRTHGLPQMRRIIDKMGYRTNIQNEKTLNMARLIAGSEGTLGVITAVKLQLPEIPAIRKTVLLLFSSMEKAMQAIPALLPFHPEACELIDRRYLHLASERDVRFDVMFPLETEAVLLVELSDSAQFSMHSRLRSLSEQIVRQKELAFQMVVSVDDAEANFFWELAGTFEPSTQFGKGKPVRITIVEDTAVTPSSLYGFFLKIQELLRKHGLTAAFYAHAVQGQVRLQPLADLHSRDDAARVLRFASDYYRLVHSMNGTIGTENGMGLSWKYWLPIFEHPSYKLTCAIKRVFDPETRFQPGKMGTEIPEPPEAPELAWRLSFRPDEPFPLYETPTGWTEDETRKGNAETKTGTRPEAGPQTELQSESRTEPLTESQTNSQTKPEPSPGAEPGDGNVFDKESDSGEEDGNASTIFVREKVLAIIGNVFDDISPGGTLEDVSLRNEPDPDEEDVLSSLTRLGLEWDSERIQQISSRCNGCGKCRGTEALKRACPIFRYDCNELSSPRAKPALMEGLLNETLELSELGDDSFRNIIHRCIQCHSCRIECPSGVDVPFLVRCAEEAWAKARGLDFYESSLVRLDVWIGRFRKVPCLVNLVFRVRLLRWFLEKMFGVARDRHLPHLEIKSYLDKIKRNPQLVKPDRSAPEVDENPVFAENTTNIQGRAVYFLDTFANHFETAVAQATVDVFRKNHVPLIVPQHQQGSGVSAVMLGRSDYVRKQVYRNAALLADYIRQGYDVVVTEPTTALAFRWEFPQTYPENQDVALVSRHCFDVGEYLYKLHMLQILQIPEKKLNLKIGYHAPCRLRALQIGLPSVHLMGLIPGVEVMQSPHGCCGMGGTYGMMASHYSSSLKIGRPLQLWLRDPQIQVGATECSACKLQMTQSTTKPVLHPIQILARAYE
ncbi:MAG: FAD-binding protein [Thermoguttaceae bacterium]|nr:FAD-binding protein [Thermoguttaceae bacterium]